MGTWGPKLYEDDVAQDIKETYEELVKTEKDNEKIIKEICSIFKEELEDQDEKSVFWMVLADLLYKQKQLTKDIKEKALKEIERGENLERWKNEASKDDYILRKKKIELLKKKLEKYDKIKEENSVKIIKKNKPKHYKYEEWKIGDVFAYKIKEPKRFAGQYLIIRKAKDSTEFANTRYQSAEVYVQITKNKELPKNREEIEKLDYIVMANMGNIKYKYKIILYQIPRKPSEEFIYLGNYTDFKALENEYDNICKWSVSPQNIKYIIERLESLGTNKKPKYKNIDPIYMDDSHIRFLMKVRYYEKELDIIPPEKAIVKDDPLLYIALVDSLMIRGFVRNPVGLSVKDMEEEANKRIDKLEKIIIDQNETHEKQQKKINILEDLRKRIAEYKSIY